MNKPGLPARIMLIMLSLGIIAVLGASLKYRLEDHPIVMHIAPQAMRTAPSAGSAPDAGREGGMSKQGLDAMAEAMQNDPEQAAMIDLMQKMQANPNAPDALLDLADMFMRRGDLERAENFINRAAVAVPSDARPPFYLGVLKERQGKYAEAAESLERSLSMQDNPAARFSLAVLRIYHLNDKPAGRAQLEAALKSPDLTGDLKKLVETELAKL